MRTAKEAIEHTIDPAWKGKPIEIH